MTTPQDYIQRSEYEQFTKTYEVRHTELRLEIKEMENDQKAQLNTMTAKIDALSVQISRKSLDAWKIIATSAVSIIIGYALDYLQHLLGK